MNATHAFCVLGSLLLATAAHAEAPQPARLISGGLGTAARVAEARFDAAAQVQQGYALLRAGKQRQAVALFDTVITDADHRLAGDNRQRLCQSAGQHIADTVTVDPSLCEAHFGKGYALIDLGRGDLAEGELRQASQMAPRNAHFANEYAELFKSRREWQQSYDLFARAWDVVDHAPTGKDAKIAARALRGMGFTKAAMGQYDEAEQFYDRSLQYDPRSAIAHAELGNIARRKAIGS